MSWNDRTAGEHEDARVADALANFKASIDAWSSAAHARPRSAQRAMRRSWNLATGWSLACTVIAVSVFAAVFEHQQNATREAAHATQQTQQIDAMQNKPAELVQTSDEDLLATVDNDISRQVPTALEPLAQMMDDDGKQK